MTTCWTSTCRLGETVVNVFCQLVVIAQDRGAPRYFLTSVLTVPVATWGPLIEGWRPTGPQPVEDEPLEVQVELAEDIINPFKNLEYSAEESAEKQKEEVQQPAEADAEVEPVEVAPPQEVLEADPPEVVCNQEDVDKMKFKERVMDLQDFQIRHLTLSTPLASRREGHVIQATAELYARYRSLQLPIKRVHTDRAKEFMGKGFQRWVANRGLQATWTAGDEPTGNGRAEVEIQNTKNRVRLLGGGSMASCCAASLRVSLSKTIGGNGPETASSDPTGDKGAREDKAVASSRTALENAVSVSYGTWPRSWNVTYIPRLLGGIG